MQTFALFVDLDSLSHALGTAGSCMDCDHITRTLREKAEELGGLALQQAHGSWSEPPARAPKEGLPAPDIREVLSQNGYSLGPEGIEEIAESLDDLIVEGKCPEVVIVATGIVDSKRFARTAGRLRKVERSLVLWHVDGIASPGLLECATQTGSIQDLLGIPSLIPIPRAAEAPKPCAPSHSPAPHVGAPTAHQVVALKLALVLEGSGLAWVPFRRLSQDLMGESLLFPTQDASKNAINAAITDGVVLKNSIPNPRVPGTSTSAIEPNPENPVTAATLNIATRIAQLLQEMHVRFPFVAFSYFNRALVTDPIISELKLSESECRDWLNYLVREGALFVAKEDNPVNPQFKVSTIKLNPSHALARMALQSGNTPCEEMRVRVALALDHYLVRKGAPWMPMSTLRTKLEPFGRVVMEQALADLQREGAIVTEKYDNPQKEFKTTGCCLRSECETIVSLVRTRDEVLGAIRELMEKYPTVPARPLEDKLAALPSMADNELDMKIWLEVLVDEGLVKLQRVSNEEVTYVLADSDPIVRRILAAAETPKPAVDGDAAWLAALAEVHGKHDLTQPQG